jgi:hypothetical protein
MTTRTLNAMEAIDPILLAPKTRAKFIKTAKKYTSMDMDEVEDTQSLLNMLLISFLTENHSKKIDAALDEDSENEYETRRKSTIRAQSPVFVARN